MAFKSSDDRELAAVGCATRAADGCQNREQGWLCWDEPFTSLMTREDAQGRERERETTRANGPRKLRREGGLGGAAGRPPPPPSYRVCVGVTAM